jgi:hypothetical protein
MLFPLSNELINALAKIMLIHFRSQIRRVNVNAKTFIFLKENVSNGLILQSAQFSDLSNASRAPNDIQITESAVNMCIVDRETSFHRYRVPYSP